MMDGSSKHDKQENPKSQNGIKTLENKKKNQMGTSKLQLLNEKLDIKKRVKKRESFGIGRSIIIKKNNSNSRWREVMVVEA